jgi:hypothetical protein
MEALMTEMLPLAAAVIVLAIVAAVMTYFEME